MPFGSIGSIRSQAQVYRRQASREDSIFPSFAKIAGPALSVLGAAGDIPDLSYIPEPLTMLGVFAGISGLGAYIRKRRMA